MPHIHYGTTPRSGYMEVKCTREETAKIADATAKVGDWIWIFSPVLGPWPITVIRGSAALLGWKARRCLEHGKCLAFTFAGLVAIPFAYDPDVPDTRPTEGNWT